MKVSIGILAWNEEASIAAMISSLASQTLLANGSGAAIEILAVPNGCTDGTARVATQALESLRSQFPKIRVATHELSTPGKANAWNEFVHHLSDPQSDYLILLDADIRLHGDETLLQLLRTLEENPGVQISTDLPIKHVEQKAKKSLLDRLLIRIGGMTQAAPGQLTGQLYAARAATLRKIVIPRGLIVEDGFLKQMVCTDGYRQKADQSLIRRAPRAAHVFECYTRPADVFNHQVRQAVGQTIYSFLRDDLQNCGRPVFEELRHRSEVNPDWLQTLIRREISRRGWWVMDTAALTMRWRRVRFARSLPQKLVFAAVAAGALFFDVPVFLVSNHKLRHGRIKGIWKDTSNRELDQRG